MKKLLFILSAIFVSATGWAANNLTQANPFAYDLSSELRNNGNTLALTYTLNADAVTSNTYNTTHGVKINLIDEQQNSYNIRHITDPNSTCVKKGRRTVEVQISEIPAAFKDKPITWEIEVYGNAKRTTPKNITEATNRPLLCHGVAVSKNPQANYAGKVFVAEASNGDATNRAWLVGKGPSLLEYNITDLSYVNFHKKIKQNGTSSGVSNFSTALPEPHRVKISEDGRIFVTSYHNNSTTAVWEYKGDNNYNQIIYRNNTESGDPNKNDRVIGMDVKGSGDNLTILLCYLNTSNAKLRCYEYVVGNKVQNAYNSGTLKCTYQLNSSTLNSIINYDSGKGAFFIKKGLVSVAYGAKDTESIWIGLDYFWNVPTYTSMLLHFGANGTKLMEYTTPSATARYGGGGIAVYIDDKTKNEVVVMGTAQPSNATYTGEFRGYEISADGKSITNATKFRVDAPTTAMINDFSIDYANNLYLVSSLEANGLNNNGTGRLMQYALPYDGKRVSRSKSSITVSDPVPNILATDLTYAPYGNENKYEFSFNVNTKPELAQICFYANEADMLANNGNYSFYYEFSEAERKQGRMSVIFDAVGGTIGDDKLLNDPNGNGLRNLPRGEYYWNVYVKTRESNVFAPIYTQPAVGASDYHRQHATVDNNPNNKGFGHIYVADHHNIAETNNRVHYVRAYTIGNATGNAQQDNQSNINDNTRYTTYWQVKSNNKVRYTRRPIVSPDGMVYIADEGANQKTAQPTWFKDPNTSTYGFVGAGLHVLDPNKQTNNANAVWEANFSNPHGTTGNQEVTTGAYFLYKDGGWKLYRTNTYEEYTIHPAGDGTDYNYQNARWNNNGYRVYSITSTANGLVHSGYNDNATTKGAFGAGDAGGQFSIVATEYGVWMCQHREKTVAEAPLVDGKPSLPDNKENIVLSFFDHSGNRKFTSYTYDSGNLTQKTSSPLQSTPGAGMAYQKRGGVEYLYLVNHAGNILEFKITGGATPTLTHTQTYVTGNGTKGAKYGAISSMNFDYAGNLVVTAGATYGVTNGVRDHQELVIYTMPYPNQENARAIPASELYRYIPERVADDFRELDLLLDHRIAKDPECYVDIYRPMLTDMLNTICLPFDINTKQLDATDYYDATLLKFSQAVVTNQNGEKILELLFTAEEDGVLKAGVPYLIQAKNPITGIVQLKQTVTFTKKQGQTVHKEFNDGQPNSIDFKGIMSTQSISVDSKPWPLILVDNNRLAEVQSSGNMRGFRAYFQLEKELDPGTRVGISARKPTPTSVVTIDGKRVNIEKFLREGRVYIRVGDSLYTINGEKL